MSGWIGVDLDGTLAYYDGWKGIDHIGEPIQPMVAKVKQWLSEGKEVRIFTARVGEDRLESERKLATLYINNWCRDHVGKRLEVTYKKDMSMQVLYDDRCVQVVKNLGLTVQESLKCKLLAIQTENFEVKQLINELLEDVS